MSAGDELDIVVALVGPDAVVMDIGGDTLLLRRGQALKLGALLAMSASGEREIGIMRLAARTSMDLYTDGPVVLVTVQDTADGTGTEAVELHSVK